MSCPNVASCNDSSVLSQPLSTIAEASIGENSRPVSDYLDGMSAENSSSDGSSLPSRSRSHSGSSYTSQSDEMGTKDPGVQSDEEDESPDAEKPAHVMEHHAGYHRQSSNHNKVRAARHHHHVAHKVHNRRSDRNKTAWYHSLNSSYKSKCEAFRRVFQNTPAADAWLMVDYACAYLKRSTGLLMQGRLYITENWICFYSKILSFKTKLVLPVKNIKSIRKERTVRVIPNAIEVIMGSNEKHFFTSFSARDRTFSIMHKVWSNGQNELVFSPEEFWEHVHEYYGDDLGIQCHDEADCNTPSVRLIEGVRNSNLPESKSKRSASEADADTSGVPAVFFNSAEEKSTTDSKSSHGTASGASPIIISESPLATSTPPPSKARTSPTQSLSADGGPSVSEPMESECEGHNHYTVEHLNALVDLPVESLYELIFKADSSFFADFALSQGHRLFKATQWFPLTGEVAVTEQENNNPVTVTQLNEQAATGTDPTYPALAVRTNYPHPDTFVEWRQMEYNVSFYFQNFYTQEYQRKLCSTVPGQRYTVVSKVVHLHTLVPLDFYVENMYCLTRVDATHSRIRITSNVNSPTNVRLIKTLMGAAQKEVKKHFANMYAALQAHCNELRKSQEKEVLLPMNMGEMTTSSKSQKRHRRVTSPNLTRGNSYSANVTPDGSGTHAKVRRRRRSDQAGSRTAAGSQNATKGREGEHFGQNSSLGNGELQQEEDLFPYTLITSVKRALTHCNRNTTLCLILVTLLLVVVYGYLQSVIRESEDLNDRFTSLLSQFERHHQNQHQRQGGNVPMDADSLQRSLHELSAMTLKTTESWTQLWLQRHTQMNASEAKQWRFVLEHTTRLIGEMLTTLKGMQTSLEAWIAEHAADSPPT